MYGHFTSLYEITEVLGTPTLRITDLCVYPLRLQKLPYFFYAQHFYVNLTDTIDSEYTSRLTTCRYSAHRSPITLCPPGTACYRQVIGNGSLRGQDCQECDVSPGTLGCLQELEQPEFKDIWLEVGEKPLSIYCCIL